MIQKMMKKFLVVALLTSLIPGQLLQAQTRLLNVRGLALERADSRPERYVKVKEGYELLSFLNSQPGEQFTTFADPSLALFEKKRNESGEEIYEVAEKIQVPAAAKGVLILSWKATDGDKYLAVDDNFSAATYNSWLMINTTSKPIALQIGKDKKPFGIDANSSQNCKVDSPQGVGAAVKAVAEIKGEIKPFYSTFWPIREKERSIVIFFERDERISLRKISDVLLVPKKSPDGQP